MKRLLLLFFLFPIILSGCSDDDRDDDCDLPKHYVIVRSLDADGADITGTGAVKEVLLYLFDTNEGYIKTISCKENERVFVGYDKHAATQIIGWGNATATNEELPTLSAGDSFQKGLISLKKTTSQDYFLFPDDLFLGSIGLQVTKGEREKRKELTHVLFLKRKSASMNIVISGAQQRYGTDQEFWITVSGIPQTLTFTGAETGAGVALKPAVTQPDAQHLSTGIFNTFPSGDYTIVVNLYRGNEKIYSASSDKNGTPFRLEEGRLLNVRIDFGDSTDVIFSITPWGQIDINQEF